MTVKYSVRGPQVHKPCIRTIVWRTINDTVCKGQSFILEVRKTKLNRPLAPIHKSLLTLTRIFDIFIEKTLATLMDGFWDDVGKYSCSINFDKLSEIQRSLYPSLYTCWSVGFPRREPRMMATLPLCIIIKILFIPANAIYKLYQFNNNINNKLSVRESVCRHQRETRESRQLLPYHSLCCLKNMQQLKALNLDNYIKRQVTP